MQIKNAGDMNRGQHHGEGQLGAHMAMLLGQQTLLGFLASPTEVNTGRAVGAHVWVYTVYSVHKCTCSIDRPPIRAKLYCCWHLLFSSNSNLRLRIPPRV